MMDVNYKPGMTLDEPIGVTMAAADWITLMTWFGIVDTEGVNHLIFGKIAQQIMEKCYDQSSIKAAKARIAEIEEENSPFAFLRRLGIPVEHVHEVPAPEEFGYGQGPWKAGANHTVYCPPECTDFHPPKGE